MNLLPISGECIIDLEYFMSKVFYLRNLFDQCSAIL